MSSSNTGATTDRTTDDGGNNNSNQGGGNNRRRNRSDSQRKGGKGSSKFEGECADLKKYVYDTGLPNSYQDLFTYTTRGIAEYVATNYNKAGEFRLGMINMDFPVLTPPGPPAVLPGVENQAANTVAIETYKIELKRHNDRMEERRHNMERVFPLILGQCSTVIRDRIESRDDWAAMNGNHDVLALLRAIRESITQRATTSHPIQTMTQAEESLCKFYQTEKMSLKAFKDKVVSLVEILEETGGGSWQLPAMVQRHLPAIPAGQVHDAATVAAATAASKDEYIAHLLITKAYRSKYGNLYGDCKNDYVKGVPRAFPRTQTEAYEMLANYVPPVLPRQSVVDPEVSFLTGHEDQTRNTGRGGGGGRGDRNGGRGGGRGRGRGGDRTRNRDGGTDESNHLQDGDEDDGQATNEDQDDSSNNSRGAARYLRHTDLGRSSDMDLREVERRVNECFAQYRHSLPKLWVLMDSCSTLHLFCNKNLLKNIRRARSPILVHCNAGTVRLTHIGDMDGIADPIWVHPEGVANILSLSKLKKEHRIKMDTDVTDCIELHDGNGKILHFTPSDKGLYHVDLENNGAWTMVTTVRKQAKKYENNQIRKALNARKMQNIIMRPGDQEFSRKIINHLQSCPVRKEDIRIARDILGPNIGSLKGKTPRRKIRPGVKGRDAVPPEILKAHKRLSISFDIFYVNQVAFLLTYSSTIRFITVKALSNRQTMTIVKALREVIRKYESRGFEVVEMRGDPEFEPMREWIPQISTGGADDHTEDAERQVRTVKDRVRSQYRMMPFKYIPRVILIRMVRNAVFWLNAFPHDQGLSSEHSPRYIMYGQELDYNKHVRTEFGQYVQTHEEHSNGMEERTTGGICLGPTGDPGGAHWFMSMKSGRLVRKSRWTELPMPPEIADRINEMGKAQGMPPTLTFGDRHAREIKDTLDEIDRWYDSDDDESYVDSENDDESLRADDDSDNGDDGGEDPDNGNGYQPQMDLIDPAMGPDPVTEEEYEDINEADEEQDENSTNDNSSETTGVEEDDVETTGVDESGENTGVESPDEDHDDESKSDDDADDQSVPGCNENTGVEVETVYDSDYEDDDVDSVYSDAEEMFPEKVPESDRFSEAADRGERAARNNEDLPKRESKRKNWASGDFVNAIFQEYDEDQLFDMMTSGKLHQTFSFVTAQMSAKAGIKRFGKAGEDAIIKELEQLVYRKVMEGKKAKGLTREEKSRALKYLMFLKEKRCGKIKGRGCADGRPQRLYKTKEETSSPTVSTEALFLTSLIDAMERRCVITMDIPGAFMQADIDETVHVKLEGEVALLLCKLAPEYRPFITYERGKPVIYAELNKALYGTVQAAYLFFKKLTKFLTEELGFEVNPYDSCVVNKTINGKQCTIAWHVDDLKISHVSEEVCEMILKRLNDEYGNEQEVVAHRGKIHDYLGMVIDFSKDGEVTFSQKKYIQETLDECPEEMFGRHVQTPAADHLFHVDDDAEKLDESQKEFFHRLVAKLLYVCKRSRPDIQLPTMFLTTRVSNPDVDDWKKLSRIMNYLRDTNDLALRLSVDDIGILRWWIDASFAVHRDFKSHTGASLSLGKGCPINMSSKQKINTRSSTEAELVGINDAMTMILWVRLFLMAQGHEIRDNIVYQDNQSTMLLAKNGRQSSGKQTRHIEIRYYFITDQIERKNVTIKYCPTEDMVADFFTKPLQGKQFRKLRKIIMNIPDDVNDRLQECVGNDEEDVQVSGESQRDSISTAHNESSNLMSSTRRSFADVVRYGSGCLQ